MNHKFWSVLPGQQVLFLHENVKDLADFLEAVELEMLGRVKKLEVPLDKSYMVFFREPHPIKDHVLLDVVESTVYCYAVQRDTTENLSQLGLELKRRICRTQTGR